MKFSMRLFS